MMFGRDSVMGWTKVRMMAGWLYHLESEERGGVLRGQQ